MIEKILDTIFKIVCFLCCIALCAQVVLVAYTVFCRNLLHFTPIWGESLTLFLLVWTSAISASLPIRDDSHVRVTLIDFVLSKRAIPYLDIVIDLLSFLYCGVIFYAGCAMCKQVANTIINGISISKAYLYAALPAAMILMMLAFIEKYYLRFKKWKEAKRTP